MAEARSIFAVTVDLVVLTVQRHTLCAILVRRDHEPFRETLALPGSFVTPDEDLPRAAARVLTAETGLSADTGHLEQLGTYGDPGRDPRGRVVTVTYLALLPDLMVSSQAVDARASWRSVSPLLAHPTSLAFDHHRLLSDGVERARAKLEYSSLATQFCPPQFTIAQLRQVYEAVWGARLDPRNFHRKVTGTPGFVVPTDDHTDGDRGRPARLYRSGPAASLHPALLRR